MDHDFAPLVGRQPPWLPANPRENDDETALLFQSGDNQFSTVNCLGWIQVNFPSCFRTLPDTFTEIPSKRFS
jgi:hypothetical protein